MAHSDPGPVVAVDSAAECIAYIQSSEPLESTQFHWLRLKTLTYVDKKGIVRKYEMAERVSNKSKNGAVQNDVAFLVATLRYPTTGRPPELLVVRQFRPPVGCDVVEFVAGLVDEGEGVEATARRELGEEVGYRSVAVRGAPVGPMVMDPGLSNSAATCVFVDIDGDDPANQPDALVSAPEECESITALRLPLGEAAARLRALEKEGCIVCGFLWMYVLGMTRGAEPVTTPTPAAAPAVKLDAPIASPAATASPYAATYPAGVWAVAAFATAALVLCLAPRRHF